MPLQTAGPADITFLGAYSHYITVSSPSGGYGGLSSTSFSAFSTRRASGQPPLTPRRAGCSSKRNLTSRTIGIYTAIFAATPWGDGSRRSGTDLHRCRSYLLIRGRSRPQSLVAQGLRIRHPLVPSEGRHSRSVPLDFGHWMIDCASMATFGAEGSAHLTLLQRIRCEIGVQLSAPIVTTT